MDTTPQPKTSAIVHALHGLRLRTLLVELLVLAVIAVLLLFGLFQAYHYTTRYSVDLTVKEPDTRLEWVGFHIPEANDEFRFRWSRPYAFFQLRNASPFAQGYLATVRLRIPTPDPDRRLTFLLNERPIAEVVPTAAFRVYHLALPVPNNESNLRLALAVPELRLPNDVRPLGVVMTSAALTPIREANLLVIAGIVLGIGFVGLGWHAPILCAGLGAALVALIAFANPMPLGVAWLAGFAIGGACIAMLSTKDIWARVGLALLCALVAFSGSLRMSWLTEDAFISFRYAQNLAQDHGLVYNIGERVEGYTNFLWTLLAALVLWLGGDIVWWSYLSGIVLALAILLLTFVLAQRLIGTHWALLAALIVATSQSLLIHTARGAGLETGLFTLLVLAGIGLVIRNLNNDAIFCVATAPIPIGLLFALATLTRPEGVLFFGFPQNRLVYQATCRYTSHDICVAACHAGLSCGCGAILPLALELLW
jgi:arabinofuranosyltransferase